MKSIKLRLIRNNNEIYFIEKNENDEEWKSYDNTSYFGEELANKKFQKAIDSYTFEVIKEVRGYELTSCPGLKLP